MNMWREMIETFSTKIREESCLKISIQIEIASHTLSRRG